jgi:trk system potassium uptake protein TrkH
MRPHIIFRYTGIVLLINVVFLLLSSLVSFIYDDSAFRPLFFCALLIGLVGVFPLLFVPASKEISNNEGLIIVVLSWLLSCFVGAIPYVLWGGEFNFTNAWFESVSGFTTTGSTILTNIEVIPQGLLFWRSSTHWIGGLGIIIFMLLIIPSLGLSGIILFKSQITPIAKDTFLNNARNTLRILLYVYVGLTVAETILLTVAGMSLFEAVNHSFATIATGGFSTRNLSIAAFDSLYVEIIIMVFMILSGIHFGLLFAAFFQTNTQIFRSTVVRYYIFAIFVGVIITAFDLVFRSSYNWSDAFRYASFQIISVGTTTGFANADSAVWPVISKILLMFFALQCACAGSTSGGIKADRIVVFLKAIGRQLNLVLHPRAVIPVRLNNKSLPESEISFNLLYIAFYLLVVSIAATVLIMMNVNVVDAFSGSIATMGNVGPGLGGVGSLGNYSHLPAIGKWILSSTMLLGRLEIFGLLIFFVPYIWKLQRN